jgi:hypothetical protein
VPAALRAAPWMGGARCSFALMAIAVREPSRPLGVFEILFLRSLVALLLLARLVARARARSAPSD